MTTDLHRLGTVERRTQEAIHDQLGHGIRDPDREPRRPAGRPTLEGLEQFAAGREDLRRVAVDNATDLRQDERTPLTLKQALTERLFQQLELGADCRLRHSKLFGSARNPSLTHDGPEVQQVVVVERVHRRPGSP